VREDEHVDEALSIPAVFALQVTAHPDKTAVIGADKIYTYKELDEASNKVANGLLRAGAEKGSVVAIMLRRTSRTVAASMGIIKAGCCFLPIDPE
jgi:acyl-CoA synthetase (AMP-forming)/AMP-acid ligase II